MILIIRYHFEKDKVTKNYVQDIANSISASYWIEKFIEDTEDTEENEKLGEVYVDCAWIATDEEMIPHKWEYV